MHKHFITIKSDNVIPFDAPYQDVKVKLEMIIEVGEGRISQSEIYLDGEDIGIILGICKYDILKIIGELIEKKEEELRT